MFLRELAFGLLILATISGCATTRKLTPEGCLIPLGVYFESKTAVDIATTKTVSAFKASNEIDVVDTIPPEARNVETISFLTCQAQKSGLITSGDELIRYTETLQKSFQVVHDDPSVSMLNSTLGDLRDFFAESGSHTFSVKIDETVDPNLSKMYFKTIRAPSWKVWFKKMCESNSECVSCSPDPSLVEDRISIGSVKALTSNTVDDMEVFVCGA